MKAPVTRRGQGQRADFGFHAFGGVAVELHQVVGHLPWQPLAAARAEKKRKAGVRIHGNAVRPTNEAGDARVRQSGVVGEAVWGNAHRLQKIFEEDFAGVNLSDEPGLFQGLSGRR
jgi:hypothetical protein